MYPAQGFKAGQNRVKRGKAASLISLNADARAYNGFTVWRYPQPQTAPPILPRPLSEFHFAPGAAP